MTVTITTTNFVDRLGHSRYGYRIYDEFGSHYSDHWKEVFHDDLITLKLIVEDCNNRVNEDVVDIMCGLFYSKGSLILDDTIYNFNEIKDILSGLEVEANIS